LTLARQGTGAAVHQDFQAVHDLFGMNHSFVVFCLADPLLRLFRSLQGFFFRELGPKWASEFSILKDFPKNISRIEPLNPKMRKCLIINKRILRFLGRIGSLRPGLNAGAGGRPTLGRGGETQERSGKGSGKKVVH